MNAAYEVPFFREQKGFAGKMVGGWQISPFLTFQIGAQSLALGLIALSLTFLGGYGGIGEARRPRQLDRRRHRGRDVDPRHGCTHQQGFLFARPMPREAFDALMRSGAVAPAGGQASRLPA